MNELERKIIDFLVMSLWFCFKRLFILFVLIPLVLCLSLKDKVEEVPVRYPVVGVVKMGYLKVRSFKSSILEKISNVAKRAPVEEAMGYQKEDLKLVLKAKFLNDRGQRKNMMDKGPFITEITFPEESNLIIIKAEGVSVEHSKKVVNEVISFLQEEFEKNKTKYITTINSRVNTLNKDRKKIVKSLKSIEKVEREFGFTPFLAKQRNELLMHEGRLRYMIVDVQSQLDPANIQDFGIVSIKGSVYPVTKRKLVYYSVVAFLGSVAAGGVLLLVSVLHYRHVPPPVPTKLLQEIG